VNDHREVFRQFDAVVRRSLANWETKLREKETEKIIYSEKYIDFRAASYTVIGGGRPDGTGYWSGELSLEERHEVLKLQTRKEELYGIAIGRIEDFGCHGAEVYCDVEGRCWYASEQFSTERVVEGWGTVEVIDGFQLRRLRYDQILVPVPHGEL
jgi:hypothetical protein